MLLRVVSSDDPGPPPSAAAASRPPEAVHVSVGESSSSPQHDVDAAPSPFRLGTFHPQQRPPKWYNCNTFAGKFAALIFFSLILSVLSIATLVSLAFNLYDGAVIAAAALTQYSWYGPYVLVIILLWKEFPVSDNAQHGARLGLAQRVDLVVRELLRRSVCLQRPVALGEARLWLLLPPVSLGVGAVARRRVYRVHCSRADRASQNGACRSTQEARG